MAKIEIDYEEFGEILNIDEQEIFVKDGKCKVCKHNGKLVFHEDHHKELFIQQFLAFHIINLRKESLEDKVIVLEYNDDRDIFHRTINPKLCDNLKICTKSEAIEKYNIDDFNNSEDIINVILSLGGISELHKYNSLDLYSTIRRPHELYDGRIVYMSMLSSKIFLKPEYQISFYQNGEIWEPVLIDQAAKKMFLDILIDKFIKKSQNDNRIHCFVFKDGDRDLIKLAHGINLYEFYSIKELDEFKENEPTYKALQNKISIKQNDEQIVYVLQYKHNIPKILSEIIIIN